MEASERAKKLSEIEDILKSFLSDKKYEGLSAFYFMPHCFAHENQGIHCIYSGSDETVIEDLLGYVDIPAMMNGFTVESVKSASYNMSHVFIYDEDRFHVDNLRKLNIMNTDKIFSKKR